MEDFSRLKDPSISLSPTTSKTDALKGSHIFEISGYSLIEGIGIEKFIASESFMGG